jgi:light-harvesting complex I chlorophyll a/b binding protein 1
LNLKTVGFDPVGFSNWIDIRWLREAEIKHARISMLAVVGVVVSSFVHLPGDVHQVGVVAAHDAAVKSGSLNQVLLWSSIFELVSLKAVVETLEGSGRAPGYFGFDPLKLSEGKSEKIQNQYALSELKNGRLAMLAFSGLITQAVLTGKDFPFV